MRVDADDDVPGVGEPTLFKVSCLLHLLSSISGCPGGWTRLQSGRFDETAPNCYQVTPAPKSTITAL